MALQVCPHMTARCPHYQHADCTNIASKDCHYVKRTTASITAAAAALRAVGIDKLSPAMQEHLREMESSLKEMKMPLLIE